MPDKFLTPHSGFSSFKLSVTIQTTKMNQFMILIEFNYDEFTIEQCLVNDHNIVSNGYDYRKVHHNHDVHNGFFKSTK